MNPDSGRNHGLDAARAFAMLLGILLHASFSFFPFPSEWAIRDRSTSWAAYVVFFHFVHMFRMAVFFLIAGYFGRLVLERKGTSGFVRDRLKRILAPLVCGWLAAFPLILAAWIWGARISGTITVKPPNVPLWRLVVTALKAGEMFEHHQFPLSYLWFLYTLLQLYAVGLVVRSVFGRWSGAADAVARAAIEWRLGFLAPALPVVAAVFFLADSLGVKAPDKSLTPVPLVLVAYGTVFGLGWLMHRQPDLLETIARRGPAHFGLGLAAGTVPLVILMQLPPGESRLLTPGLHAAHAAGYGLGFVLLMLGFTGMMLRWCARPSRIIRYLSDSAYWLYLAHLPLVVAMQVEVARWNGHWTMKLALIVSCSLAILLASYQYLVRYTLIGFVLNGPRQRRQPPALEPLRAYQAGR